jgi:hypothetical protein
MTSGEMRTARAVDTGARIFQIVPQVTSQADGVSAFAAALGAEMSALGADVRLTEAFVRAGDSASTDAASSIPLALRDLTSRDRILLHYVGYGYHPRGVPRALVALMRTLRATLGAGNVGTIFHEVYASGPPWRSSFWLLPMQRTIARRLLRISGVASSSLELYQTLLARLAPEKEVELLPIPSTVGEPSELPVWSTRSRVLAVFGTPGVRQRAYHRESEALQATIVAGGIAEVLDIGDGSVAPSAIAGVPVRTLGRIPADAVSRALLDSRVGFLAYPPDFLDKSTIFAGFCAHGVAPVVAWSGRGRRRPRDGEGWELATGAGLAGDTDRLPEVAVAAKARYARCSLRHHAEFWLDRLGSR